MKAIEVKDVVKGFEDRKGMLPNWMKPAQKVFYAVDSVSFDVDEGEIFGVLGPNGCGKSTLIRMLSTLLYQDKGTVKVLGHDVMENPEMVKLLINRVSVEANFFKSLSARENLLYAARLYGLTKAETKRRMEQILGDLQFPMDKLDEPMSKFSRGQQQKVAIARGFLSYPKVLLLDEPTTGLDPKSKIDVQKFIDSIREELGITILITSHDMEEVERLCDRISIMNQGKIVAQGTAEELKRLVQEKEAYALRTSDNTGAQELLEELDEVDEACLENGTIRFLTGDFGAALHRITHALQHAGIALEDVSKVEPTLEDVFIELTGRSIQEEEIKDS